MAASVTTYMVDAEQALGRGLKLLTCNWQFAATTTDATGCVNVTFTSFSKILHAWIGGAVVGGYSMGVYSITNNVLKLQLWKADAAGTGNQLGKANAVAMTNLYVRLCIVGYA